MLPFHKNKSPVFIGTPQIKIKFKYYI